MSSQNDETKAMGMAIAIVIAAFYAIFIVAALALLFICFALTIACLFAWNKPLKLGKDVLMPEDARAYIKRGLHGAYLLPAFCIFLEIAFNVRINGEYLPHIIVAGYALGSLGVELWYADQMQNGGSSPTIIPPGQQIAPHALPSQPDAVSHNATASEAAPFRYASWDDEVGPSDPKPKKCDACAFLPAQVMRPPR